MATNENLPPRVIKQLARELKSLDECPPDDIRVIVNDDNFSTIYADIEGPPGTPYAGGVFRMKLVLNQDFPHTPPKGYFITKIFHPNISKTGEICVNTLKKDWKPTLGLRHVLLVVRCLLIEPFPESALNEEAGKMLMEDYEEYAKHARLMTSIHAVKSRAKTKVAIGESTVINAAPTDNFSSTQVLMSTSNVPKEQSADTCPPCTVDMNVSAGVTSSPRKPEGDPGAVKLLGEKKKIDARKKSLKRL